MHLSENRFHHIHEDGILLNQNTNTRYVIERNEFACDCGLQWLFNEQGNQPYSQFFASSICYTPQAVKGKAPGSSSQN